MEQQVQFIEVGPRDGFQSVKEYIPVPVKLRIIDALVAAGVKRMEMTSFVSPKAIPQLKDAAEVVQKTLEKHDNSEMEFYALVPNIYGAKAALAAGLSEVATVISVSESHNKANINRTVAQSLEGLERMRQELPDLCINLSMATAFTCPFEGVTPIENVLRIIRRGTELGITRFCLADTIGQADPQMVRRTLRIVQAVFPDITLDVHIHDTRNMGVACSLAAIEAGVTHVQAALGGLGGCPFAPGASGNVASEDLLYMLDCMGYHTGIQFDRVLQAAKYEAAVIHGNFSSHQIHIGEPCHR
ncbi:hydroxymethylglutaryl-CoA lyase [Megasphaera cerevisiae DSM 20462]|jgi:hydroxymethylglutaryl-CoA lyase|uniref:Hydroxymethylglutaryl-CoA lyase n=1 Tax=Megasphaera cerevisiae DSM 20462 TaxID=1122219 RepID=A0A0J6WYH6_9FIRM|nr:hydroxymethylglutaryl-CoA lyase [Megasphaera cerevisiae]KMO87313.1 hydroxymethylglutaryl-CoA lyase [Megasphaera cerevisiae DSM 20462]OKY54573.1 hydroxymethylglutaryl-CoA lyase [Megasphaera cerevisiae]SJZ47948.1 hydroxymethylglutaryl-CoA lyase [Megasphaera cerevisiae DSM 20462]